jgi:hypothetical protein
VAATGCHNFVHISVRAKFLLWPMTLTTQPEVENVFTYSSIGLVGSTPTKGKDICLRLMCCPCK